MRGFADMVDVRDQALEELEVEFPGALDEVGWRGSGGQGGSGRRSQGHCRRHLLQSRQPYLTHC